MIEFIAPERHWSLSDYASVHNLAGAVRDLRVEASMLVPALRKRTIWMINSTAQGGGVAEMLPRMVTILEELGLDVRWVVIGSRRPEFFDLTKQLHNLIHGEGDPVLDDDARELYEEVNREAADNLIGKLNDNDILVVHDPQPLAMGAFLKRDLGLDMIWRCHIGLDEHLPTTRAAWTFLQPYASTCDRAVFSAPEYIPDYLAGYSTIIHPAIDPCGHKNRAVSPHKLVGILCNAGLTRQHHPVLTPAFSEPAHRLRPDGTFAPAGEQPEVGLLYRPIVTQVSRWDRLKGFGPLLEGFVRLKESVRQPNRQLPDRHRRRLELVRLVLAGPDPRSIQDDPEGVEVLNDLIESYRGLDPAIQEDVAILSLPMGSRKENALMVNALQRCSTVVVQNSIREGFGLTATEAMWKNVGVLGTRACGLRHQIRSGIDGSLIQDARDPDEIARRLDDILENVPKRDQLARNARQRVSDKYLVFTQLCNWLHVLGG